MKHYEKLADKYVEKYINQKWNEHAVKTFKADFISGYKTAMEELKTKSFQDQVSIRFYNRDEKPDYIFRKIDLDCATLEQIYDSLNREAE